MLRRMTRWGVTMRQRATRESGQGLAEYAMILAFVAILAIAALASMGVAIRDSPGFTTLVNAF